MTGGALQAFLFGVACLYGLVSGFNDGGSLLASFTSGRVIAPRLAALLLLFAPVGAFLLAGPVAQTVAVSVIDLPGQGVVGFVAVVGVAVLVVLASWAARIPTSMTLSLIGAMLGWALVGRTAVGWSGVARVVIGIPLSVLLGGVLAWLLYRLVRRVLGGVSHRRMLLAARLQIASAAFQAFAYGANDMAKTVGLIGVGRALGAPGAQLSFHDGLAIWASFLAFLAGTLLGGWGLAYRVGFGVFRVRPVQAMTEQMAAAAAVAGLALAGAPVSTTQTISGSLVGIGVTVRASAVRWGVLREMVAVWLVTLPLGVLAAGFAHLLLRALGVVHR